MNRGITFLLTGLFALATGCGNTRSDKTDSIPPGISWASILAKAIDLKALAEPAHFSVATKMSSSCFSSNKVSFTYLAPQIIGDMDYGSFLEVTEGKDNVSATLAEFNGPGMVTWIWSANPVGTLKLYVDNEEQPVLSMPFTEFLRGRFLPVRWPFSAETARGYNLHFPIVHTKYCKLVLTVRSRADLSELYYQVAWQSLPTKVEIHSFDIAAIKQQSDLLGEFGRKLCAVSKSCEPAEAGVATVKRTEYSIQPGQSLELFHSEGPQAITAIRFIGKSKSDLNGLWIKALWDGEVCVQSPLHMLAGISSGMEDTESFPAMVDGSRLVLRWFMPFTTEGQMICTNTTDHVCKFTIDIWTQPIDASHYPLRFHSNFLTFKGLQTDVVNVLTLADVSGEGRFVGCTLGVDNQSDKWWGEGDNIIWLDDTNNPALHGTGTEDYFGFAWCSEDVFNHPFRGQTMVANIPHHTIANMHRYHILDTLPFQKWGRFQFGALGNGEGEMDWSTSVMWYSINHQKQLSIETGNGKR
ncbi:MAG: DUF2961 domain-containing protein [Verrucomicrobiota bacterium]